MEPHQVPEIEIPPTMEPRLSEGDCGQKNTPWSRLVGKLGVISLDGIDIKVKRNSRKSIMNVWIVGKYV